MADFSHKSLHFIHHLPVTFDDARSILSRFRRSGDIAARPRAAACQPHLMVQPAFGVAGLSVRERRTEHLVSGMQCISSIDLLLLQKEEIRKNRIGETFHLVVLREMRACRPRLPADLGALCLEFPAAVHGLAGGIAYQRLMTHVAMGEFVHVIPFCIPDNRQ
jgi:hypothetical protein